jgi:hypothetical protein
MALRVWAQRPNSRTKANRNSGKKSATGASTARKVRLGLEALEDRTLLSTFTQSFQQSTAAQFASNQAVNTFLGDTFDASDSFGSIHHVDLLGKFGATAQMNISGRAGLDLTFSGARGGVSTNYNATVNQDHAEPTQFGQIFINPANTFVRVNSGNFSTTSPSFGYGASLDLGLHGSIGGSFYAFDQGGGGSFSFGGDVSIPLMSVNENDSGVVNLLGLNIVGASPGLGLSTTMQHLRGAIQNFLAGYKLYYGLTDDPPLRLKLDLRTPQDLQFIQDLQLQLGLPDRLGPYEVPSLLQNYRANLGLDLGNITEQAPTIDLSSSSLQSGGLLTATGRGNVAQLSIQTGPLAAVLLGQPELAALGDTTYVNLGPFNVGFTPLSFQIQPTLFASQTASIEPVSHLTYNFSDANGNPLSVLTTLNGAAATSATSVSFTPGKDTLGIDFQGQPITVTPTWTFGENFHNQVSLKAGLDGLLQIGKFTVHVPGLGDRTFGPLYQKTFHFVDTTLQDLFDQSTPIFSQQVPLAPFTIGSNFHGSTLVTSFSDSAAQNSGSLRFAVLSANAEDSSAPVVIQLAAGTYNLTIHPTAIQDGASGDIAVTAPNLIIVGAGSGSTTINAAGLGDRLFHVKNGAHVKFVGVKITGGSASDDNPGIGGGIFQDAGSSLEFDGCWITGNTAGSDGGGIHSQGTLTINSSTVSNNTVGSGSGTAVGAGVAVESGTVVIEGSTLSGNSAANSTNAYGGGLYASHSTATLVASTVTGNTADGETSGSTGQAHGGGVYAEWGGTTLIVNSTIYQNHVRSGAGEGFGGGVSILGSGTLYLVGDTIDSNTASNGDSGIESPMSIVMKNTIVTHNDMFNSVTFFAGAPILSGGNNLIDNTQQGLAYVNARHNLQFSSTGVATASASGFDPTDVIGTYNQPLDPLLGTFGANGGPTQTLPLLAGSPAIDAGGNSFAIPSILDQLPDTDQRGLAGIVNATRDIGAVEYQYDLTLSGTESLSNTTQLTYAYTVSSAGPDPASGITLTFPLPGGVRYLGATVPSGWTATGLSSGDTSGTLTIAQNAGSNLLTGQSAAFSIRVQLTDPLPSAPVSATASINTAPWDSNAGNNQVTSTVFPEGLPFTNTVLAYFASSNPDLTAADFSASVAWGDGSSNSPTNGPGAITVVPNPLGGFNVVGSHTYADAGNYSPAISLSGPGGFSLTLHPQVAVTDQELTPAGPIAPPALSLNPSFQDSVLFHFFDPDASLGAGDFQATVYWGDQTNNRANDGTGKVRVVADATGGFDVLGTHSYGSSVKGTLYAVRVVDANGLVIVNPALFHFSDGNPQATAADFTATVDWADGSTQHSSDASPSVFVVANPAGGFDVLAAHAYTQYLRAGSLHVTVQDDDGARVDGFGPVEVDYPLTAGTLSVPNVHTEGDQIQDALLFHFSDGDAQGQATDFEVTVLWGDGTDSQTSGSAYVRANTAGGFDVFGSHVFGEAPTGATFGVTVNDFFGALTGASGTLAGVADPAVLATGVAPATFSQGLDTGSLTVATFTDPGGPEDADAYAADIAWGDGTTGPADVIQPNGDGSFSVLGSHVYTKIGNHTLTVTVHHAQAADATAVSSVRVSDPAVAAVGGSSLTGNEGDLLSNKLLATFTDPGGADRLGNYNVTIAWGDGSSTTNVPVSLAATPAWSFVSHQPVGQWPASVAAADFNGDDKPDLAVANALGQSVQVALGNGDGTFQDPQTYALGVRPAWLAVGDLNGDLKPDVVTADPSADSISVLLNTGSGTLGAPVRVGTGTNAHGASFVALADLNGDGKLDAITANSASDTVSIFLGNGNGTFQAPVSYAVGGQGPAAVAIGDVNGDGQPDLVVADTKTNDVRLFLGNGNGTFQTAQTLAVGAAPESVALADLRGNHRLDIVTANGVDNTVSVLLNNGGGSFQAAVAYAVGNTPVVVLAQDVNGDSKPDLVTANNADNSLSVLAGNGDGTLQAATGYGIGAAPTAVVAADVNGDGRPELIAADSVGNELGLLLPAYAVVGSHAYADNGNYTITVSVQNAGGNTATAGPS